MECLNLVIQLKSIIPSIYDTLTEERRTDAAMTFLKQFISMSTSERGGTQFKEFTGINMNKSKDDFIAPNQVSQQPP